MSRILLQQAFIALRSAGRNDGNYQDYSDVADAIEAELAKPEAVQVRPHEFISIASKQADMVGTPFVWSEYPTRPERVFVVHDVGCAVNGYGACDCFGGVKT